MILGGVLVGGSSRRMGHDKATLRVQGRALAEIAEDALRPHCAEVHRLGPDGIKDVPHVAGPLAGILAAQRYAPTAWWIILACDMPLIGPEAVGWLLEQRIDGAIAVLPQTPDGQVQPTCALYGPGSESLLSTLSAPHQAVGELQVLSPVIPASLAPQWANVNDPEALKSLGLV
ncbi:MAG: molybdenum cofactor guanylyltransferase [Myxococcota bacterium]